MHSGNAVSARKDVCNRKGMPARSLCDVFEVISHGVNGVALGNSIITLASGSQFEAVNWNDDACTDLIAGTTLLLSPRNDSQPAKHNIARHSSAPSPRPFLQEAAGAIPPGLPTR